MLGKLYLFYTLTLISDCEQSYEAQQVKHLCPNKSQNMADITIMYKIQKVDLVVCTKSYFMTNLSKSAYSQDIA